jgi:DNA-binding GntR family transcriptional regulator
MTDVSPEEMAEGLAILTGFRAAELLGTAHAFLALTPGDPRLRRIWLALAAAGEAEEAGDRNAAFEHDREFVLGLLQLVL